MTPGQIYRFLKWSNLPLRVDINNYENHWFVLKYLYSIYKVLLLPIITIKSKTISVTRKEEGAVPLSNV